MRSRVTPKARPTSSSVHGGMPSSPKRSSITCRSRSGSAESACSTASRRSESVAVSNGDSADSSSTKSPSSDSSSSPIGFSSEIGSCEILRMSQLPISLEKPIGEEEESELGDFVEDESAESPFDTATLSLRREAVEHALSALPERERQVIELRFGLLGMPPCTLEEVGRAFGVTRERIRQIENNTLKKLESLPEAQGLKDCV